MDVREVLGINDALIEFEITSNRPDCRSIIGIAREAAVTLGKELKYPEIKVNGSDEEMSFEIDIQTDLCKRYCGKVVKDVKVGPSPYWMQRKTYRSWNETNKQHSRYNKLCYVRTWTTTSCI